MGYFREVVLKNAEDWLGKKSTNKSNQVILNTYNVHKPLPRGYKVKATDNWCATFASAVFIRSNYDDIFPIECSCGKMIELAKKMGIWIEADNYIPHIGDCLLYDWDDNGKGDNTGWPDHIGIVTYVNQSSGYIVVIEGNYSKSVKKRTICINGKYIRGYITPKFTAYSEETTPTTAPVLTGKSINTVAHEVIAGQWGSGAKRQQRLASAGYDYKKVQEEVNRILNTPKSNAQVVESGVKPTNIDTSVADTYETTANLYVREAAGTNKKMLVKAPKGTKATCNGTFSTYGGVRWFYITVVVNGKTYTGYSHSGYLKRRA